jgi:hypothetical protein
MVGSKRILYLFYWFEFTQLSRLKGGELMVGAKAIPFQEVLNLSINIRKRLKKEANGFEQLEELKTTNPKLAQLIVDLDWTLTNWGYQIVRASTKKY